jgi:hypothetical protein
METLILRNTIEDITILEGEEFIICTYSSLLGRYPDPTGLTHNLNLLRVGTSKSDIISDLCQSREYKEKRKNFGITHQTSKEIEGFGNLEFVQELYRLILLREPDPSGLEHYVGQLNSGADRNVITAAIYASDESMELHFIVGLKQLLVINRLVNFPVLGYFLTLIIYFVNLRKSLKALRALEAAVSKNISGR